MKILLAPLKFLAAILRAILSLFGINIGDPAPQKILPAAPKTANEIIAEAYARDSKLANDILKPQRNFQNNAGFAVFKYASAENTTERATLDLSALSPKQQAWLFMQSDSELEALKNGGLLTCMQALKKHDRKSKLEANNTNTNANTHAHKNDFAQRVYEFTMSPSFA